MNETKQCRDCEGWFPLVDFYTSSCTADRRAVYCKECHKIRTAGSVQRQREQRKAKGLPPNAYRAPKEHNDRYLDRHIAARQKEAEIEATLQRVERGSNTNAGEMSFADIKFNSLDPEPVFRDLTNYFQRPQTKVSFWKTA